MLKIKHTRLTILLIFYLLGHTVSRSTDDKGLVPKSIASLKQKYEREREHNHTTALKNQIAMVDSAINNANKNNLHDNLIPLYIQKAELEYNNNQYTSAYPNYDSAIINIYRHDGEDKYKNVLPLLYLQQGRISYILGKYDMGISYMYKLLRMNLNGKPEIKAQAYTQLGKLYTRLGKNNFALKTIGNATEELKGIKRGSAARDSIEFEINIALSSAYIQKHDFEKALHHIEKARKASKGRYASKIYQNLSILHFATREYAPALDYCKKAINTASNAYDKCVLTNNCIIMYCKMKDYTQALQLCESNMEEINNIDAIHVKSNLFYIMSNIYADKQDYKKALEYKHKEQELLDSVFNRESEERIMRLNNEFETAKIKQDKTISEYNLKLAELKNFRKNTLIALMAVLTAIAAALVIFTIKKAKKQKARLKHKLIQLDENQNRIIQSIKNEFEENIDRKSRELATNTMLTAKANDTINHITDELKELSTRCGDKNLKSTLHDIQQEIASLTSEDKGWENFRIHFEQVHPSFFTQLNKVHPNLTVNECRTCAFIVMHLNSKEIATLTNRSVRTVDTTKFRLRKKLDIPKDITTLSYLCRFTKENENS